MSRVPVVALPGDSPASLLEIAVAVARGAEAPPAGDHRGRAPSRARS